MHMQQVAASHCETKVQKIFQYTFVQTILIFSMQQGT